MAIGPLALLRPPPPEVRDAFRTALGSPAPWARILAARAFRGVEDPTAGEREAMEKAREDEHPQLRIAARDVLSSPGWSD